MYHQRKSRCLSSVIWTVKNVKHPHHHIITSPHHHICNNNIYTLIYRYIEDRCSRYSLFRYMDDTPNKDIVSPKPLNLCCWNDERTLMETLL